MRRAHIPSLALFLALLGGALAPSSAHAQLKPKLPGKLGKVISGEKNQSSAVPKFNDRTIEITEAHAAAIASGLRMQNDSLEARWVAYAAAKKAYDDSARAYPGRQKEYERKRAEWDACQDREVKPVMAAGEAEIQQAQDEMTGGDPDAMERAMAAVAERVKAAQARGDMNEVMRLADSVAKASTKATARATAASEKMQAAAGACGVEPEEPRAPYQPVYDRAILPIPRNPSLWASEEQYGVMIDRIDPLLAMDGKRDFDTALATAFSESEQAAIGKYSDDLRAQMERRRVLLERD